MIKYIKENSYEKFKAAVTSQRTNSDTLQRADASMECRTEAEAWHGAGSGWQQNLKAIVKSSWLNLLHFFFPIAIAVKATDQSGPVVLTICALALIPLSANLTYATEQLSFQLGQSMSALINITFSNLVEFILYIIALTKNEVSLIQASIIGSVLSNVLLQLGTSFILGGILRKSQVFAACAAGYYSSVLVVASISLLLSTLVTRLDPALPVSNILSFSRGVSVIFLLCYSLYILFQIKTHSSLFTTHLEHEIIAANSVIRAKIAKRYAVALLVISTGCLSLLSEFLTDAISEIIKSTTLSTGFVGMIFLPTIANASQIYIALAMATKDKMSISVGTSLGSGMQILLLVTPLLVLIGWWTHKELALTFPMLTVTVLAMTSLLLCHLLRDGRSDYFKGVLLISLYFVTAIVVFYVSDASVM